MLDKIEVGSKWKSNDGSGTVTVDAVEKTLIAYHWFDGTKGATTILDFRTAFEPLPSPEPPVDDVIWEWTGSDEYRYRINRGVPEWLCPEPGSDWQKDEQEVIQAMASEIADLYARLNPPTTTVEEWPKKGDRYWLAAPTCDTFFSGHIWGDDDMDLRWKERGLIFKTEEEAIAKAKKMVEEVMK